MTSDDGVWFGAGGRGGSCSVSLGKLGSHFESTTTDGLVGFEGSSARARALLKVINWYSQEMWR